MKLSVILLSNLLCATSISASTLAQRVQKRLEQGVGFGSKPLHLVESITEDASNISYSGNWAGAVITSPPPGTQFSTVAAQFVFPNASIPASKDPNTESVYIGSAWVGIDGDTARDAILQTGVDWIIIVDGKGNTTYEFAAWYEWYPDYEYNFALDVSPGDTISISVEATSNTTGNCFVTNDSTGEGVNMTLSAVDNTTLARQNAEWIVEDPAFLGLFFFPIAEFSNVTFTGCEAGVVGTDDGEFVETLKPNDTSAVLFDIKQGGVVLTASSFTDTNDVTVSYVPV